MEYLPKFEGKIALQKNGPLRYSTGMGRREAPPHTRAVSMGLVEAAISLQFSAGIPRVSPHRFELPPGTIVICSVPQPFIREEKLAAN